MAGEVIVAILMSGRVLMPAVLALGLTGCGPTLRGIEAEGPIGDTGDTTEAEQREVERAKATWRTSGEAGIASAVEAFCGWEGGAVRNAAESFLKSAGPKAVPLLAGRAQPAPGHRCWSIRMVPTVAAMLCAAQPGNEDLLRASLATLPRKSDPSREKSLDAGSFAERVLLLALTGGTESQAFACPAHDPLARALISDVLPPGRLASLPEERRQHVLVQLRQVGPEGAPYVPVLAGMLEDGSGRSWTSRHAIVTLSSMGAAARDALPAVQRALDRLSEGSQAPSFPEAGPGRVEQVAGLIGILAGIGEPAASVAPRLVDLMHRELREHGLPSGQLLLAVVRALPHMSTNHAAELVPDVEALLRYRVTGEAPFPLNLDPEPCRAYHGDPCPPVPQPRPGRWADAEDLPRQHAHPMFVVTWAALIDATAGLGAPARVLMPWLLHLMLDPAAHLGLRAAAARTLSALGADGGDGVLQATLIRRRRELEQLPPRLSSRHYTQPANTRRREATVFAAESLRLCLGSAEPDAEADFEEQNDLANHRFDRCLGQQLCGPRPADRAAAVRVCCDYAYVASRPALCR